ncbi:hypothetical protein ACHWQZ_G007149 [Mnemiopsis leidyi]
MWKKPQAAYIKIVVIGRSGVGKTSIIKTFQHLQYSTSGGIPSDETDRRYPCQIDGNEISFLIQDSVVGEKDQRIRALSYKDADVFLLLFDISNCEGKSIIPKWWVELKHFCPNVPVIAVASKVDLRDDLAIRTLSRVRCAALAENIGALEYMEVHSFDECLSGCYDAISKMSCPKKTVHIKTVNVGCDGVGKTCWYQTYVTRRFPSDEDYVPTIFDGYAHNCTVNGTPLSVGFWDTICGEDDEFRKLRRLSYPRTDVFTLCFDVADTERLPMVEWWANEELRLSNPDTPIILVATKTDLREGQPVTVSREEGEAMAKKIRAAGYFEISSLKMEGDYDVTIELINVRSKLERPELKLLIFHDTNVVVILYSVAHRTSFMDVENIWSRDAATP